MLHMAKVTIRRGDSEYEISDLTFEEVKELVGVNGYSSHAQKQPNPLPTIQPRLISPSDAYASFVKNLSERGGLFLAILGAHPNGIEANNLAGQLGFTDARQIGGLTGAGIARIANKYGLKIKDVYRSEITFPSNKRTVMFYPGKLILGALEEKPAV